MALTAVPCATPERFNTPSTTITTTLYDLIAAVQDMMEPGEEALVVPTVLHVLRRHRASWHGQASVWEET
jgi:hypothetical protein